MKSRVELGNEVSGGGDSIQAGQGLNSHPVPLEILSTTRTAIKVLEKNCFSFAIYMIVMEFTKQAAYSFALAHDNAFFNFSFTTIRAL